MLDSEGKLVSCIDGHASIIEGSDCWADPRMADGFALILRLELVGPRLEGLGPGWDAFPSPWCDVLPA